MSVSHCLLRYFFRLSLFIGDRAVIYSITLCVAFCPLLATLHGKRGAIGNLTILVTHTGSVIVQMADFSLHLSVGYLGRGHDVTQIFLLRHGNRKKFSTGANQTE